MARVRTSAGEPDRPATSTAPPLSNDSTDGGLARRPKAEARSTDGVLAARPRPTGVAKRRKDPPPRGPTMSPQVRQVGLLIGLSLCVFVIVALATYHSTDDSLSVAGTGSVQNWGGPVGATLADALYQSVGWSAWSVLFVVAWCALRLAGRKVGGWGSAVLLVTGLVMLAGTLQLALHAIDRPFPPGGLVGILLVNALVPQISEVGTALLLATGLLGSATLLFGINWQPVAARAVDKVQTGAPAAVRAVGAAGVGALRAGVRMGGASVSALKDRFSGEEEYEEEEEDWEEGGTGAIDDVTDPPSLSDPHALTSARAAADAFAAERAAEKAAAESAAAERAAAEKAAAERAAAEKAAAERAAAERAAAEKAAQRALPDRRAPGPRAGEFDPPTVRAPAPVIHRADVAPRPDPMRAEPGRALLRPDDDLSASIRPPTRRPEARDARPLDEPERPTQAAGRTLVEVEWTGERSTVNPPITGRRNEGLADVLSRKHDPPSDPGRRLVARPPVDDRTPFAPAPSGRPPADVRRLLDPVVDEPADRPTYDRPSGDRPTSDGSSVARPPVARPPVAPIDDPEDDDLFDDPPSAAFAPRPEPRPEARPEPRYAPAEPARPVEVARAIIPPYEPPEPRPAPRPKARPGNASDAAVLPGNLRSGGAGDDGRPVRAHPSHFQLPGLGILDDHPAIVAGTDEGLLLDQSRRLSAKLLDFGVEGRVTAIRPGPVITLFEYEPAPGVKLSRIASLSDDLAMALKALSVRIVAPIPGRGVVGIEIPNEKRQTVWARDVFASPEFRDGGRTLPLVLGKDTEGKPFVGDLAKMPHLLIGGTTGSGKSVGVNSMLVSLLFQRPPEELRLILVDPKMLEFELYQDIPHLLHPVVTEAKLASAVLKWACVEMDERYRLLARWQTRNIEGYNEKVERELQDWTPEKARRYAPKDWPEGDLLPTPKKLPFIVCVIDELADLMMVAAKDVEESIVRLAQKARACGIHLIVATQRPSVDVITGLIKANMPSRIAYQVRSKTDGRTILDQNGAETLLGKGDLLFLPPGTAGLIRIHGPFLTDDEVRRVAEHLKAQGPPDYAPKIKLEDAAGDDEDVSEEMDENYDRAVEFALEKGRISTSMIQRLLKIGYNRAARIMEIMEREGVVGPADGAKPREVLVQR